MEKLKTTAVSKSDHDSNSSIAIQGISEKRMKVYIAYKEKKRDLIVSLIVDYVAIVGALKTTE